MLRNLTSLYLYSIQIEELPKDVFSSLKSLAWIRLDGNNLKVIHGDSFGILPNLTEVYLYNNQIDAIHEKFIDNTGVWRLDMRNNICVSIIETSASREPMRSRLQKCFENYKILGSGENF